jgi:hypothetical protein
MILLKTIELYYNIFKNSMNLKFSKSSFVKSLTFLSYKSTKNKSKIRNTASVFQNLVIVDLF